MNEEQEEGRFNRTPMMEFDVIRHREPNKVITYKNVVELIKVDNALFIRYWKNGFREAITIYDAISVISV